MAPDNTALGGTAFTVSIDAKVRGVTTGISARDRAQTSVDLAMLAGLNPADVICEIVNDDGTMARVPDLIRFCKKHDLVMITVADLARYRLELDDESLGMMEGLFPVGFMNSAAELGLACVVLKPGQALSVDELIAHCRRSLANYKIPRRIEFSETELPKSGSGKILKRILRERFWAPQERAVA